MPWSPPKKITIIIALILEIVGLFLSLVATGLLYIEGFNVPPWAAFLGAVLCFIGWLLMVLGAFFKGV